MFPRVAELILVWAFPWPSGRRPAQGPPRLQVLVDELQAFLAAGHLVGFKSVDGATIFRRAAGHRARSGRFPRMLVYSANLD